MNRNADATRAPHADGTIKRRLRALAAVALLLNLTAGPGRAATSSPAPRSVTLDARPLKLTVTPRRLTARTYSEDDPSEWGHPAGLRFELGPQDPQRQEAVLAVYTVQGLLDANPTGVGDVLKRNLSRLRALLRSRPAAPAGELPYLLPPNAGQVLTARLGYLTFPGGHALRYLTMYSSDVSPVTSDRLFYTVQGLTDDGRFAVILTFPVTTRLLPARYEAVPAAQRDAINQGDGYAAYLSRTVQILAAARPPDFTPTLDALDAVVRSVQVRP